MTHIARVYAACFPNRWKCCQRLSINFFYMHTVDTRRKARDFLPSILQSVKVPVQLTRDRACNRVHYEHCDEVSRATEVCFQTFRNTLKSNFWQFSAGWWLCSNKNRNDWLEYKGLHLLFKTFFSRAGSTSTRSTISKPFKNDCSHNPNPQFILLIQMAHMFKISRETLQQQKINTKEQSQTNGDNY